MTFPIYFQNPGEIDIRGATIAGLSAKADDTAIGEFGTGLKYAIANVLRWGGNIEIWSGLTRYMFSADEIDFRGKSFSQILMHTASGDTRIPLGFTTEYGKNWQPWQILRELLANARDEGGDSYISQQQPAAGQTLIIVNCQQLAAIYHERNVILLPTDTSWHPASHAQLLLLARPSPSIYYKGVRVADEPCALTYNLLDKMKLTEDRTVANRYELMALISRHLQLVTDEELLRIALTSDGYEKKLDFHGWNPVSSEFLNVAADLYRQNPVKHARLQQLLEEKRPAAVAHQPLQLSPMRQRMLDRAIVLCARLDMPLGDRKLVVADLGQNILGKWNPGLSTIYISPLVFEQGTKQVMSTLYEELWHATTGHDDCTYQMQTALFNKIISLAEEHIFNEPI